MAEISFFLFNILIYDEWMMTFHGFHIRDDQHAKCKFPMSTNFHLGMMKLSGKSDIIMIVNWCTKQEVNSPIRKPSCNLAHNTKSLHECELTR
jgi:hypothetical protein